jgi:hypothetical protein
MPPKLYHLIVSQNQFFFDRYVPWLKIINNWNHLINNSIVLIGSSSVGSACFISQWRCSWVCVTTCLKWSARRTLSVSSSSRSCSSSLVSCACCFGSCTSLSALLVSHSTQIQILACEILFICNTLRLHMVASRMLKFDYISITSIYNASII